MRSEKVRILLVEDDPDDVWIMRSLLGDRWDGPFELVHVELLSTGLSRCANDTFDVVLLDLSLPDSQGLETFLAMFAHVSEIPIVILTGYDDEMIAVKAVQAGAQDYLVKGQVSDALLVRSIRYAIERSRRDHAEAALRDTDEEFRAAQEIQQRLYPEAAPKLSGFDIAGAIYPARATAGDYFDFIPMAKDCLGVVVGDVSGHGMGPAIIMSETRACLRTLVQLYSDPGDILTRANHVLTSDTGEFHFVTLAMVRLDPANRLLVYASSGQRGHLLGADGRVKILDSTAVPLCVQPDTVVPTAAPIQLNAGEIVVLCTDGVFEAESPGRVRFGAERALEVIRGERDKKAEEIVAALHADVSGFTRQPAPSDDMTIVIVKFDP